MIRKSKTPSFRSIKKFLVFFWHLPLIFITSTFGLFMQLKSIMLAFMFLIVNIESYNYLYNYCWHFTFTSH